MIQSVFYIPQMSINQQLSMKLNYIQRYFFVLKVYNKPLEGQNKIMFETKGSFNKTASTNVDSKFGTTVSWIESTDNPENLINRNPQYKKIYMQFLKNNTRTKGVFDLNKEKQIQSETKSFISKSLECRKRTSEFEDKFNQQYKLSNRKRSMTGLKKINLEIQKIGETLYQKGKLQKKLFFSETKKGIELQEQTMLLQYYYKDKDEFAVKNYLKNQRNCVKNFNYYDFNIDYLRNRNHSQKKHKRFEPNKKQFQQLMLAHDQKYFEKIKKINFIKQEKIENEYFKMAQKNYQWKRENNFHQMQQIIKLNRENLLLESIKNTSQQTIKNEQKFNKTIKFFLKFAYLQKIKRTFYEYIDDEGMDKLIIFILQNDFNSKITKNALKQILGKIIKHKIESKIEIYDLMEFIDTIDERYAVNILDLVSQKCPHYFTKNEEITMQFFHNFSNNNIDEIKKQTNPERIPFIVRLIFESSPQKLILNQFLPVKAVPKILQHSGITGDDIPREKLLEFLYWNQRRPEGLNYNQFYFSFLMLGVLNNNWRNIYKLLERIKINEFIQ